jgi:methylthioribose-1-phosphate isomerase
MSKEREELTEARIREIAREEIKLVFEEMDKARMKMITGVIKEQRVAI